MLDHKLTSLEWHPLAAILIGVTLICIIASWWLHEKYMARRKRYQQLVRAPFVAEAERLLRAFIKSPSEAMYTLAWHHLNKHKIKMSELSEDLIIIFSNTAQGITTKPEECQPKECGCSLSTALTGDGCDVCNPQQLTKKDVVSPPSHMEEPADSPFYQYPTKHL